MNDTNWWERLRDPLPGRVPKPRISGLTMIIDTGIPLSMFHDLMQMASEHVDYWKFAFGSAGVCVPETIHSKVSLCQEYGVLAYPGGTSMEIAISQGVWKDYLEALWSGGIRIVEVSDGTIDLAADTRKRVIERAKNMGFTVLTEVGKKRVNSWIPVEEQAKVIRADLHAGAEYVIVEGRESGQDIGVYEADGSVRERDVEALITTMGPLATRLIWEAPLTSQQTYYISRFGNRVNLGNVRPLDIVALESIRRGLRSDTLRISMDDKGGPDGDGKNAVTGSDKDTEKDAQKNSQQAQDPGPTLWDRASKRVNRNGGPPGNRPKRDGGERS